MSKAIDNQSDNSRRRALKKLGLGLAAAYSAPALLILSGCHAHAQYRPHKYPHRHGSYYSRPSYRYPHRHGSYPSYSRPSYSRPSRHSRPSRW